MKTLNMGGNFSMKAPYITGKEGLEITEHHT